MVTTEKSFTRIFEEIDTANRAQLREAGCRVKRITNIAQETKIYGKKTVQQVTFPSGSREEIQRENAGMIRIRRSIYSLPNGQVFVEYAQGVESCSLRRAYHYEQTQQDGA
jgi:hypothetical protein